MKSLLSILASTSLIASSGAIVTSCAGQAIDLKYGEMGVLKELLNINIDTLRSIPNARALWEKIEEIIADRNEITKLAPEETEDETSVDSIFNVKRFNIEMSDASNNNTTDFGESNERRFIFITYTEKLVRGTLNSEGTDFVENPKPEILVELESDFASFAIINN